MSFRPIFPSSIQLDQFLLFAAFKSNVKKKQAERRSKKPNIVWLYHTVLSLQNQIILLLLETRRRSSDIHRTKKINCFLHLYLAQAFVSFPAFAPPSCSAEESFFFMSFPTLIHSFIAMTWHWLLFTGFYCPIPSLMPFGRFVGLLVVLSACLPQHLSLSLIVIYEIVGSTYTHHHVQGVIVLTKGMVLYIEMKLARNVSSKEGGWRRKGRAYKVVPDEALQIHQHETRTNDSHQFHSFAFLNSHPLPIPWQFLSW